MEAPNIAGAKRFLEQGLPSLAIPDINLGGDETSVELAEMLMEKGCPIIFLSGYTRKTVALPDNLATLPRLSKPFVPEELVAEVSKVLKNG